MIATLWELWNDRHGDFNKEFDVAVRIVLFGIEALIIGLLTDFHKQPLECLLLSGSFHFLFFDYAISYILIKNGTLEPPRGITYHWFDYHGKSGAVDRIKLWRTMNRWVRLGIRLTIFTIALTIFII